jgi:hypothetical protein
MNTRKITISIVIVITCLVNNPLWAMHESGHDLSDQEWWIVKDRVELLDSINYMPTLLPTIMRNRDVLQLTDQQIKSFRDWRKQHYGNMVKTMNEIIEKRVAFKEAALDPGVSGDELLKMQNDVLVLQKKLLKIKLTCRNMLVSTFTEEQWDNFAFAVADQPRIASFLQ